MLCKCLVLFTIWRSYIFILLRLCQLHFSALSALCVAGFFANPRTCWVLGISEAPIVWKYFHSVQLRFWPTPIYFATSHMQSSYFWDLFHLGYTKNYSMRSLSTSRMLFFNQLTSINSTLITPSSVHVHFLSLRVPKAAHMIPLGVRKVTFTIPRHHLASFIYWPTTVLFKTLLTPSYKFDFSLHFVNAHYCPTRVPPSSSPFLSWLCSPLGIFCFLTKHTFFVLW